MKRFFVKLMVVAAAAHKRMLDREEIKLVAFTIVKFWLVELVEFRDPGYISRI